MVQIIYIQVLHGTSIYDYLILTRHFICKLSNYTQEHDVVTTEKVSRRKVKVALNGIILHYLIKELYIGYRYRNSFVDTISQCSNTNALKVSLVPPDKEIIDYDWNYRIDHLVREKCELEHALSWLSTLGGAFSALGDYFNRCAHIAGKISVNQLRLAIRLGDSGIASRCMLYYSLSLIQCKRFKLARKIIIKQYSNALNQSVPDIRLLNMCKGIWSKLKYEMGKTTSV